VKEESERVKASEGIVMTEAMQIEYKDEWLRINKDMLQYAGLGMPMFGEDRPIFCGGILFSMSFSKHAVPYRALQFWKIHLIFVLWNYSQLQHGTSRLCHFVWQ
jgi:hypothetical protein